MTHAAISEIQHLIDGGNFFAAEQAAEKFVENEPASSEGWLLLILAGQRLNHFHIVCNAAERAAQLLSEQPAVRLKWIQALLLCGRGMHARDQLQQLENEHRHDAQVLSRIADLYCEAGEHRERLRCARAALQLQPTHKQLLANAAAAETACGNMSAAEEILDHLIQQFPGDCGAYYRRSILRRQVPENNHIDAMEQKLESIAAGSPDVVPLCYALTKEHEDLGNSETMFRYLQRGAAQRRRQMSYAVSDDVVAMRDIATIFNSDLLSTATPVASQAIAIFVMGLPRSGTTLVDRIISCHSMVQSLGEINDLAYVITRLAHEGSNRPLKKAELITVSAQLDFGKVGQEYLRSVAGYGFHKPIFIDKTPWNFLYLGLIALALPQARIIHVKRHPLDSCFALYKTLFRGGSPYSYDLNDLAHYYIAYHQLMEHWRKHLGTRFMEIEYEHIIGSQQHATEALLLHCGLQFEECCLDFHRNPSPVATASAAQVREPIHSRSVAAWKQYAPQLQMLSDQLQAAGINIA